MSAASIAALVILVATYIGVAAGGVPGLRLDRPGIAFLGGAAMIALGPLSLDEAFADRGGGSRNGTGDGVSGIMSGAKARTADRSFGQKGAVTEMRAGRTPGEHPAV
jgi:hypothetical protein